MNNCIELNYLIGHGSGAVSATHLSLSPISRELIGGVVAMSGSAFTKNMIDDSPVQSVQQIAEFNNCGSARNKTEILKCLRERDVKDIVLQDSQVQTERLQGQALMKAMTGAAGFALVVEKPYDNRGLPPILDGLPDVKLKAGLIKKIPLLTGVTKHETANGFLLNQVRDNFLSATEFLKVISGGLNLDKILPVNLPKIDIPGTGKNSRSTLSHHVQHVIEIQFRRKHVTTGGLFKNSGDIRSDQNCSKGNSITD